MRTALPGAPTRRSNDRSAMSAPLIHAAQPEETPVIEYVDHRA
jgi:hypothetical protein